MTDLWPLPEDPLVAEVEELAQQHRLFERYRELDRAPRFPAAEFRALGTAHLLGLTVRPELGGRGLAPSRAAILLFHLARLAGTTFAKLSLQPEFSSVLADHGPAALVDAWYRPLVRGERLVGNQITEPSCGSDAAALALEATRTEGGYLLAGTKSEAAFATDADAAIVYGRLPGTQGPDGVTAFLVPQGGKGLARTTDGIDLGERWQRRGSVRYDRVLVPSEERIGEEGAAFGYLRAELARERGLLAAIYLGVARASWEETVAHVGTRKAFGRRLADQPAVSVPLVEDAAELQATWLFTLESLRRLEREEDNSAATAVAKVRAARGALTALDHAIQYCGGAGYSSRMPHEQRWRDVRSGALAHGPSEVLLGLASRRLFAPARR